MKKTGLKQLMIVSLLAASGTMVQSCSKTEKPVSGTGNTAAHEKTTILTSADALDFAGEIHNAGMTAAIASANYNRSTDSEKYTFFTTFTRAEFASRSLPDEGITEIDGEYYLPHLRNTSVADLYDEAYEEGFEDMPRRVPDISKISETVGFRPEMSLDGILERVIDYQIGRRRAAGD